jgi:hypothetical protein
MDARFARSFLNQLPTTSIALGARMPSARIKTLAVEDAHSLAEDLRIRGFAVEIVPPDKVSSEPVDLEVTLEECDPEAALHLAENVPEAEDLCVFVAPGALTEGHRTIKMIPLFSEPVARVVTMPAPAQEVVLEEKEILEEPVAFEEPEKFVPAEPAPIVAAKPPLPVQDIPRAVEAPTVVSPKVPHVAPVAAKPARKAEWATAVSALRKSLVANQRILRKTATVAAMAAVAAVSVLVLGSTVRRFAPIPSEKQPASASMVLPATASASSTAMEPKPRAIVPQPKIASRAKARRTHNPEEDVVAKDYVIRFDKKPAVRAQTKKTPGVKHYSDLDRRGR